MPFFNASLAQLVEHRSPKSVVWVRVLHGVPMGLKLKWYKRPAHNGEIISSNLIGPTKIQEIRMLQFLKRLFCFHHYDYESDIFVQVECRKCGKRRDNYAN